MISYAGHVRFRLEDATPCAGGGRVSYRGKIGTDFIDANDHLNVLGFDQIFDYGEHYIFEALGIWDPWIEARRESLFRLEKLLRYENELRLGQTVEVRSHILRSNGKLIHHFHELWDCDNNRRSAMFDALSIHVDLNLRKGVRVRDQAVLKALTQLCRESAALAPPKGAQRREISGELLA